MTDPDPYAVLGVPRTATRAEIAHAYRALAKRHHPDAGAPPSPEMARINDAWFLLSDASRRASWDRGHATAQLAPPHWRPAPDEPPLRPQPRPTAPPSRMDSGWAAAAVIAAVAIVIGLVLIGISAATQPEDDRLLANTAAMSFLHEPDWARANGDGDDPPEHQVLAHLATWNADPELLCTTYGEACGIQAAAIPRGEALVFITSHEGGVPPEPEPVTSRPYGLDADAIIGGEPAAFEITDLEDGLTLAWWQLSPPGFPDRWIEVRALMRDTAVPGSSVLGEIQNMLGTVEFVDEP